MELQTRIPLDKASPAIEFQSKLLLVGSCFADHMAKKLHYYRFQLLSNPFGVLFNPIAIGRLLDRALNRQRYTEDELFYLNERWHSFDAHSDLSRISNNETLEALNDALEITHEQILEATHIVITLGTAWVYRHRESECIVANCHKVPQKEFSKELLSVDAIKGSLAGMIDLIEKANENATVILTISPVRHLKDGFSENNRSKAHLITAVQDCVEEGRAQYFPAFELVMDELRDYRFYAADMIHPNELAIDYIWQRFSEVWIDVHSYPIMKAVDEVQKGLQHRPYHPESDSHKEFRKKIDAKILELQSLYPHMEFNR